MQINAREHNAVSFLETFVYEISPRLKEIDLLIKTAEDDLTVEEVARVLSLAETEVFEIMEKAKITVIDQSNFFKIMEEGSSMICSLYRREKDCGSPYLYTPKHISYIYDLDLDLVADICNNLHIKEITNYTLPLIFSHVPVQREQ